MSNIIQEKIKKEAEGYGKLAPAFIEGAKFALENQWISVKEDLPCNHEDMYNMSGSLIYTDDLLALSDNKPVITCMMFNDNTGKWKWDKSFKITHWMSIPKVPKD